MNEEIEKVAEAIELAIKTSPTIEGDACAVDLTRDELLALAEAAIAAYNPNERLPELTGAATGRILQDIASEERDSGGPDDGNPYHTFTTRISDVKALIAAVSRLREALAMFVDAAKPRGPDGYHEMPRFSARELEIARSALSPLPQGED